jgi:hypothetical protein
MVFAVVHFVDVIVNLDVGFEFFTIIFVSGESSDDGE